MTQVESGRRWRRTHPEAGKKYYAENRDRIRAQHREYFARTEGRPHRVKAWRQQGINLTWQGYEALLASQSGHCAICGLPPSGKKRLGVDHDHATGRVRGLLCHRCNTMVGLAGDQPGTLESAATYLRGVM